MKARHTIWLLGLHVGLLILAATRFTAVSWAWGSRTFAVQYLRCAYRRGSGFIYRSDDSLAVVLAYLASFLLGAIAYQLAGRRVARACRQPGLALCVVGMISFLIEGSHWIWAHHLSLIAICPAASLVLAVIAMVQLAKGREPSA